MFQPLCQKYQFWFCITEATTNTTGEEERSILLTTGFIPYHISQNKIKQGTKLWCCCCCCCCCCCAKPRLLLQFSVECLFSNRGRPKRRIPSPPDRAPAAVPAARGSGLDWSDLDTSVWNSGRRPAKVGLACILHTVGLRRFVSLSLSPCG